MHLQAAGLCSNLRIFLRFCRRDRRPDASAVVWRAWTGELCEPAILRNAENYPWHQWQSDVCEARFDQERHDEKGYFYPIYSCGGKIEHAANVHDVKSVQHVEGKESRRIVAPQGASNRVCSQGRRDTSRCEQKWPSQIRPEQFKEYLRETTCELKSARKVLGGARLADCCEHKVLNGCVAIGFEGIFKEQMEGDRGLRLAAFEDAFERCPADLARLNESTVERAAPDVAPYKAPDVCEIV